MQNFLLSLVLTLIAAATAQAEGIDALARQQADALRFHGYLTADHVKQLARDTAARDASPATLHAVGITGVMLEVYRGGVEVEQADLETLRDFYLDHDFKVIGAIATVAGGDFGVGSNRGNYWFNYEAQKTRNDLERVCRRAARVFDTFIVDDFLCTGDDSEETLRAKGDRSWVDYRRALMGDIAQHVIIGPMREENPDIRLIVKFPQWYDRFHLFGYDVEGFPQHFDGVWVGTETRGRDTQRFGFTEPYEGFVNYRWLASLSGSKIAGAWFDHGDCDGPDFIEQAWTTVLAGATDIVLFQYGDLSATHPGHALLRQDFAQLADLARAVAAHPATGVAAYKPAQSDAGGDLYIMDFVGMFGVPLVPTHTFPENADIIFLPTQAAADPDAVAKARRALERGVQLVVSAGFLADAKDGDWLAHVAGVDWVERRPMQVDTVWMRPGEVHKLSRPLDLEGVLDAVDGDAVISAQSEKGEVSFLTRAIWRDSNIFVLNAHTFSQADFDAVGEVFLSPRPLGLMELNQPLADAIRNVFTAKLPVQLSAPVGVTQFLLTDGTVVLQNHNDVPADITLDSGDSPYTSPAATCEDGKLHATIPPRGRIIARPES